MEGLNYLHQLFLISSFVEPLTTGSSQKRHKKHKHKKHKRKKMSQEEESFMDISVESDLKKTFKVRIKKEEDRRYNFK